jgi:hypothetical protein
LSHRSKASGDTLTEVVKCSSSRAA